MMSCHIALHLYSTCKHSGKPTRGTERWVGGGVDGLYQTSTWLAPLASWREADGMKISTCMNEESVCTLHCWRNKPQSNKVQLNLAGIFIFETIMGFNAKKNLFCNRQQMSTWYFALKFFGTTSYVYNTRASKERIHTHRTSDWKVIMSNHIFKFASIDMSQTAPESDQYFINKHKHARRTLRAPQRDYLTSLYNPTKKSNWTGWLVCARESPISPYVDSSGAVLC